MKTGFELFMENPYWKGYFDNAPSKSLKDYIKFKFNNNLSIVSEKEENYFEKRKALEDKLTNEDWEYLIANTDSGMAKTEYRRHLK